MSDNIKSSLVWKKFEPKKRTKIMGKYTKRFVVVLSESKKVLYLSDMIIAKLVRPDWIALDGHENLIGLRLGSKDDGYKVDYAKTSSPHITIAGFIKEYEADGQTFNPGVYECRVEVIDAQQVDHYDLVVFDTCDHPSKA